MLAEIRLAGSPEVSDKWSEIRHAKLVDKSQHLVWEVMSRAFTGDRKNIFRSRTRSVKLYAGERFGCERLGFEAFPLPGLKETHISWSGLHKRQIVVTRHGGLHWILQSSVDRRGNDMVISNKAFSDEDWLQHGRRVTAAIEKLISV